MTESPEFARATCMTQRELWSDDRDLGRRVQSALSTDIAARVRENRYPYAYGYLYSQVEGFLDGSISREELKGRMAAIEDALKERP